MSDDEKIYVDASRPATLNSGGGVLDDCPTLQEAVMAWHRRPSRRKGRRSKFLADRFILRRRSSGSTTDTSRECDAPPSCRLTTREVSQRRLRLCHLSQPKSHAKSAPPLLPKKRTMRHGCGQAMHAPDTFVFLWFTMVARHPVRHGGDKKGRKKWQRQTLRSCGRRERSS